MHIFRIHTYINGDRGTYEEKVCSYGKKIEIVVAAEIFMKYINCEYNCCKTHPFVLWIWKKHFLFIINTSISKGTYEAHIK